MSVRPMTPAEKAADQLEQEASRLLLIANELRASAPQRPRKRSGKRVSMYEMAFGKKGAR